MRKYTYMVSLKEFLKLVKCLSSRSIHMVFDNMLIKHDNSWLFMHIKA